MDGQDLLSDYLTREVLAQQLAISPRTVMRYEQEPDGLPSVMIGGRKYYRRADVTAWLERRVIRPNPTSRERRASA
ncbi:MAG: helix-turn-helix domain-containing protein [Oceanicaulis sp.]